MKQNASRRLIAIATASACLSGALFASAQAPAASDIAGPWLLKSGEYADGCILSGQIRFNVPDTAGALPCTLLVEVRCTGHAARPAEYWRVRQSCSAKLSGDSIRITSRIDRVEDATSNGAPQSPDARARYVSDNFDLVLAKNRGEMTGYSVGTYSRMQMRFWRDEDLSS